MKKRILYAIGGLVVLAGISWGTIIWLDSLATVESVEPESEEETSVVDGVETQTDDEKIKDLEEDRVAVAGTITDEDLKEFEEKGLSPFATKATVNDLTDYEYQEYIHGMSHQKVKSSKKWGFYEIHPKRIEWLLEGLDKNDLSHEQVYRQILEKWKAGNFSSADKDHNAIWEIQNGTVGKATGLLSAQEEQAYINSMARD